MGEVPTRTKLGALHEEAQAANEIRRWYLVNGKQKPKNGHES